MKRMLVLSAAFIMVMMAFTMVVGNSSADEGGKWTKTEWGKWKIDYEKGHYKYQMNNGWKYDSKYSKDWPSDGAWIKTHYHYKDIHYRYSIQLEENDDGTYDYYITIESQAKHGEKTKTEWVIEGITLNTG